MSKKPNFNMGAMGNMQNMMKQVKKLQKQMAEEQADLKTKTFEGVSADHLVTATFSGERRLKAIQIKKEAIDPDDPDMLQDLVIDAVNKGLSAVDEASQASLGKYTKDLM